jgi:hypothetical protein
MAKRGTKGGHIHVTVVVKPEHWERLRAEAFKRAAAAGFGRPDASAVLRELLDAWVAKHPK